MTDCQHKERSHGALEKSTVHGQASRGTNGWLIMFCCVLYPHPFWRHWLRKIRRMAVFSRKERMFPYMTCYWHFMLETLSLSLASYHPSSYHLGIWGKQSLLSRDGRAWITLWRIPITSDVIHHSCLYCLFNWWHTIWQMSLRKGRAHLGSQLEGADHHGEDITVTAAAWGRWPPPLCPWLGSREW